MKTATQPTKLSILHQEARPITRRVFASLCLIAGLGKKDQLMGADTVELSVEAKTEGASLHVSYSLTNRGAVSILSFDGAKGTGAGEFPDITGQCYVSVRGSGVAS